MQVTHSSQYRQTTTMSEDLLGESKLSSNKQPAHKQGVHLSASGGGRGRFRERERSVSETNGARKRGRETEREKARAGVKVELRGKRSQIPTPPPTQSQVNWIIKSQGRYRHHLPRIAHKTTSVWLHCGRAGSSRTLSLNIQGTLNEEVMNLS